MAARLRERLKDRFLGDLDPARILPILTKIITARSRSERTVLVRHTAAVGRPTRARSGGAGIPQPRIDAFSAQFSIRAQVSR